MVKIRFNLGKGDKYMKWKIEDKKSGTLLYLEPEDFTIHMFNAKLRNQKATAEKIHKGSNKTVCAWIECEEIQISGVAEKGAQELSYNPRVAPYWRKGDENVDGKSFDYLFTNSKKVYA